VGLFVRQWIGFLPSSSFLLYLCNSINTRFGSSVTAFLSLFNQSKLLILTLKGEDCNTVLELNREKEKELEGLQSFLEDNVNGRKS
jgi:hypothetical protein